MRAYLPFLARFLEIKNASHCQNDILEGANVNCDGAQVFPYFPVLKLGANGLLQGKESAGLVARAQQGVGQIVPALKVLCG